MRQLNLAPIYFLSSRPGQAAVQSFSVEEFCECLWSSRSVVRTVRERGSGKTVKRFKSRAKARAYLQARNMAHARRRGYKVPAARREAEVTMAGKGSRRRRAVYRDKVGGKPQPKAPAPAQPVKARKGKPRAAKGKG